jgi:ActR/RegA family two-component response regulator
MVAKVLFVDDDLAATTTLIRALERSGANYTYLTTPSADRAKELCTTVKPEVAVLDLSLNPAEGPESGLRLVG